MKKLREIEARLQAEESEERANTILRQMHDGFWITNPQAGQIVDANEALCRMVGYTREEMLKMSVADVEANDSPKEIAQRIQQIIQTGTAHFESCFRRKDGTLLDVEISVMYLPKQGVLFGFHRDITERKQAENALHVSERRLHLATTAGNIGIWDWDVGKDKLVWEDSMYSLYGICKEDFNGAYEAWSRTLHPDDRQFAEEEIQAALRGEREYNPEFRIVHPDGEVKILKAASQTMRDQNGNVLRMIGINYDITEHKHAEEKLRESEDRYRRLVENAPDIVYTFSNHRGGIYYSPRVEQVLGYSAEHLYAHPMLWNESIHPEDHPRIAEIIGNFEVRKPFDIEYRIQDAQGNWHWLRDRSIGREVGGGEVLIEGLATDITEHKQAEEELAQSHALLTNLARLVPSVIYQYRLYPDGRSTFPYSSPGMKDIYEVTPEEVREDATPVFGRLHPDDYNRVADSIQESARTLDTFYCEFRVILPRQGLRWRWSQAQPERMDDGGTLWHGIISDITERKQRENELQAIATLSAALRAAPTCAEMLPVIIEQLMYLFNCETASVEIIDSLTGDSVLEAAQGVWKTLIGARQKSGVGINAIISQTRKPYYSTDLKNDPNLNYPEDMYEDIHGGAGVPLFAQDKLIGFLWVGRKTEIAESEVRLLVAVADIAANAIHRATLHEQTQKDAADLTLAYDSTLEGWARALELRDHETEGHTRRVVQMTVDLARAMGIDEGELEHIQRGALLHDIGKMGIPDSILLKAGALDEGEWEIMRQHPEYAYKLLEPIGYLRPVLDIPYCHHERWDGSGYPRGLKGEQIPLAARLFAIVDVWDALISDRPYRAAWSKEKVLAHIAEQSGKHFDPAVVEAFLKII